MQTLSERLDYANEHLDEILDSANQPLDGDLSAKFWINSDEPWVTLAACVEIRDALRLVSGR